MNTENLATLNIHKFKSQEQYEAAKNQSLVTDADLCLIPEDDSLESRVATLEEKVAALESALAAFLG